jgi:hypothetical protein
VFPVRYELNFYIVVRRNSVFKGLISSRENVIIVQEMLPMQFYLGMLLIRVYKVLSKSLEQFGDSYIFFYLTSVTDLNLTKICEAVVENADLL